MTESELLRSIADKLDAGEKRCVAGVVLARLALELMGKRKPS